MASEGAVAKGPTCLLQNLLNNSKQHQLSLFTSSDHVTIGRLFMQAWREIRAVAETIALGDALLKV